MMKNIKAPLSHILNVSMLNGSARDNFASQGTFGNVWRYLGLSKLVGRGAIESMVRDAAHHPTVHRTALTTESYPAQNVSSTGCETLIYPLHPQLFVSVQPYVEFSMYLLVANRTFNCLFVSFLLRYPVSLCQEKSSY